MKLRFISKDNKYFDIKIDKASKIKINKKMLILEEKNDKIILNWTEGLLDEMSEIDRIEMIRERN